jgi:hypothetical protein
MKLQLRLRVLKYLFTVESRESSIFILTVYGLENRGSILKESKGRASRLVLVPTQVPTECVLGAISRGKVAGT